MENVDAYYDHEYTILVESEEEDQIYEVRDSKPVYRTEHQVSTLLTKLELSENAKLLDYGCAKSSTIKALLNARPDIDAHLFDISERYIPFWEKFIAQGNWATYTPKAEWNDYFDVITSFFSLEHIVHPAEVLRGVVDLLKPGGIFYAIVPNVLTNTADFIVVDHVNHFTGASLGYLLNDAGLEVMEIDDSAHCGAFVVTARKPEEGAAATEPYVAVITPTDTVKQLANISEYWRSAQANVHAFEATLPKHEAWAIYGSGFYGAFIASCLAEPEKVACYLDQNPYLQGRKMNDRPIIAPTELPAHVKVIFVGLNPAHARQIMGSVEALQQRELRYFFL